MADTADTALPVGTVVRYHGSIECEHWSIWVVVDVDGTGRYALMDREYPTVSTLSQVRRASVTPTGETVPMCGCGHAVEWAHRYDLEACGICNCLRHTPRVASLSNDR